MAAGVGRRLVNGVTSVGSGDTETIVPIPTKKEQVRSPETSKTQPVGIKESPELDPTGNLDVKNSKP